MSTRKTPEVEPAPAAIEAPAPEVEPAPAAIEAPAPEAMPLSLKEREARSLARRMARRIQE